MFIKKWAEVLGIISWGMKVIVIVGMYGKIMMIMLMIYFLWECGISCMVFFGGIVFDFEINFVEG